LHRELGEHFPKGLWEQMVMQNCKQTGSFVFKAYDTSKPEHVYMVILLNKSVNNYQITIDV